MASESHDEAARAGGQPDGGADADLDHRLANPWRIDGFLIQSSVLTTPQGFTVSATVWPCKPPRASTGQLRRSV
jgi:hypothetical protein